MWSKSDTEPTALFSRPTIKKRNASRNQKGCEFNLTLLLQVPNAFEDLIAAKRIVRESKLLIYSRQVSIKTLIKNKGIDRRTYLIFCLSSVEANNLHAFSKCNSSRFKAIQFTIN